MTKYNHEAENMKDAIGFSIEELDTKIDAFLVKLNSMGERKLSVDIEEFEKHFSKKELAAMCVLSTCETELEDPIMEIFKEAAKSGGIDLVGVLKTEAKKRTMGDA